MARALVSIYDKYKTTFLKWVALPTPSEYNGISTTLVDSGRNSKGQVIGDVIASDIAKIELKWNYLTVAQYSAIAKLFEPKYNNNDNSVFFRPVSFFDVVAGAFEGDVSLPPSSTNKIRLFYCGDRKVQFAQMKLKSDGTPEGYTNVSLHLIDTGKIYEG